MNAAQRKTIKRLESEGYHRVGNHEAVGIHDGEHYWVYLMRRPYEADLAVLKDGTTEHRMTTPGAMRL